MSKSLLTAFGVAATAGAVTLGMTTGPATADAASVSHTPRTVTIGRRERHRGQPGRRRPRRLRSRRPADRDRRPHRPRRPQGGHQQLHRHLHRRQAAHRRLLTFVYELPGGKIITNGTARLSASGPVFDEQFAITGGTGSYKNASGEVRVLQKTLEQAKVTFKIQR